MKIKESYAMLLFLVIPFFRPDVISTVYKGSIVDKIFILWRIIAFLMILIKAISRFMLRDVVSVGLIAFFELVMCGSIIINHMPISARMVSMGNFLGIVLISLYYSKNSPKKFINTIFYYFLFLVSTNAFFSFVFPSGFNRGVSDSSRINFLGTDNLISLFFVVAILVAYLYKQYYPKSKMPAVMVGVIILTEIYYFSGTGVIACCVSLVLLLMLEKNIMPSIIYNPFIIIGLFGIFEVVLVFLENTKYISFIFILLKKSSTFSDRFYYWRQAIAQIKQSPIIGCGSGVVDLWGNGYYSHNAFLDVLLKGGSIAAAILIIILLYALLKGKKGNYHANRVWKAIYLACIPALMIGMMEGLEDRIAFNFLVALLLSARYLALEKRY